MALAVRAEDHQPRRGAWSGRSHEQAGEARASKPSPGPRGARRRRRRPVGRTLGGQGRRIGRAAGRRDDRREGRAGTGAVGHRRSPPGGPRAVACDDRRAHAGHRRVRRPAGDCRRCEGPAHGSSRADRRRDGRRRTACRLSGERSSGRLAGARRGAHGRSARCSAWQAGGGRAGHGGVARPRRDAAEGGRRHQARGGSGRSGGAVAHGHSVARRRPGGAGERSPACQVGGHTAAVGRPSGGAVRHPCALAGIHAPRWVAPAGAAGHRQRCRASRLSRLHRGRGQGERDAGSAAARERSGRAVGGEPSAGPRGGDRLHLRGRGRQ